MATVTRDGVELHYELVGDGPPLVLLPGLGLSGAAWNDVVPHLPGRRLVILDTRGGGRSDKPGGPYTAQQLADDVIAVLDDAGVDHASILGLSLGGMIAQEVALRHPDRVRALVLLSTYAKPDDWARRLYELRMELLQRLGLDAQFKLSTLVLFSPYSLRAHPELVDRVERIFGAAPPDPEGYRNQMQYCLDHDAAARLGELSVPALVVAGGRDLIASPAQGRELADAMTDGRYLEIENASHALWLEHPRELGDAVMTFLADAERS